MLSDLTLGQVWDVDLLKNESIIKDVIQVAQGEMALEEFLKQVKETWQTYELEMVNYQNKCRLIRGWDDLFNKVNTQNPVAPLTWVPCVIRNPSIFEQWVLEPINFETWKP